MNRFFGLMPVEEIEIEKHYYKNEVIIQAGKHGWSIIFKDGSSEYNDCNDSAENNFNTAYNIAIKYFGELK